MVKKIKEIFSFVVKCEECKHVTKVKIRLVQPAHFKVACEKCDKLYQVRISSVTNPEPIIEPYNEYNLMEY